MRHSRPALAAAADLSGTWKFDNTFNGKVSSIHCTLVQKDDALTGSCKPDIEGMAASKLTGTVKGAAAKWGLRPRIQRQARARGFRPHAGQRNGSLSGNLLRNGSGSLIKGVRQPYGFNHQRKDPPTELLRRFEGPMRNVLPLFLTCALLQHKQPMAHGAAASKGPPPTPAQTGSGHSAGVFKSRGAGRSKKQARGHLICHRPARRSSTSGS
ncbi:MAG: hypothetical protein WDO12_06755 [Pseudomonadota bacterium]